ncbi:amino acid permease 3-like [Cornus florida]|uniref:amino acid permease 3-like n=1 Tax=Cornus florida TaxID=4283 RepID=UPI002897AD8D|nr:amino acid permease 3-like [Cornus florida]
MELYMFFSFSHFLPYRVKWTTQNGAYMCPVVICHSLNFPKEKKTKKKFNAPSPCIKHTQTQIITPKNLYIDLRFCMGDHQSSSAEEGQLNHTRIVHSFDLSINVNFPPPEDSKCCLDDHRHPKTTGNVWRATAHIMTAAMGPGLLSVAWAIAQLGWISGPLAIFLFSFLIYYTSTLLAACYNSGDPVTGNRNYTYTDTVRSSNLGGVQVKICGVIQYLKLFQGAITSTISASRSMMGIKWYNCYRQSGGTNPCVFSSKPYMIAFGLIGIISSQIPDFDGMLWLSIVAVVMVFTYSTISISIGIGKVAGTGKFMGSITGISIGSSVTPAQKIWSIFQALGTIAFAYSYSEILIEIQDTIKSSPTEAKSVAMKKANLRSVAIMTTAYMFSGCMGYAALGDQTQEFLLDGFDRPYWLLEIAYAAIVIQQFGAFQINSQPIFAFIEKSVSERFPQIDSIIKEIEIPIQGFKLYKFKIFLPLKGYKFKLFRLVWRTMFVIITTLVAMLVPFDDAFSIMDAIAFWPLTIYFPVTMYIEQKKIPKWSIKWISLQILSVACLLITIAAASGSIAAIVDYSKFYVPFETYLS